MFDHERLDVYQLQLKFISWTTQLIVEIKDETGATTRDVRDQLDRASLSGLLNTAEGNGKRQRQVRARYFDDARGSTAECAACLDALVAKGLCTAERVHDGKLMLARIGQMLTRLVTLYSDTDRVREDAEAYESDS
jgi:four helix bundle protein